MTKGWHTCAFSACVAFAAFAPVSHADSAADIGSRLHSAPVVEGHFVQRQKLVSIPKVFIFWENDVLLWKTVQPVRTTSVYTDQNFKTYVHLNDKTITNTSLSATNIINRILWALLNKDMTALELDFQIFTQNNDSGWRMDFYPRSNMTGSIVKHVLVEGASAPQKIVVENYSNDITTLEISEITRSEISSSRQENELANP